MKTSLNVNFEDIIPEESKRCPRVFTIKRNWLDVLIKKSDTTILRIIFCLETSKKQFLLEKFDVYMLSFCELNWSCILGG